MVMGPPEGSILIAQMVIKLGISTTKIKYLTESINQSKYICNKYITGGSKVAWAIPKLTPRKQKLQSK